MLETKLPKSKIYLTRRNLLTLLSKLDREAAGEATSCAIIKYKQDGIEEYAQTMAAVMVIAVDDHKYYSAMDRLAGVVHPSDEPK